MKGNRRYFVAPAAAIAASLLTWFFVAASLRYTGRLVATYDAGAVVLLALYWMHLMHADPEHTQKYAAVQDPGKTFVFFLVLGAVAIGLIAAIGVIGRAPGHHDRLHAVYLSLGISAVALGWFLIHTSFTFRYAHLYYRDADRDLRADAGLIFPGKALPNDFDFAYFSFVLGMTFQVSDVQITSAVIRRVALSHALVSFAYNAAIFAVTVNVLASLLQSG